MAHNWHTSKRPPHPPGWAELRKYVIARAGGICQHEDGCNFDGNQVDHIVNLASGGTHDPDNLQLLCDWHHKRKTAREAAQARALVTRPTEARPVAKHPGIL